MPYMIESFDADDNPLGKKPVPVAKIDKYIAKAKRLGCDLDIYDFEIIDGELSIDSEDPDQYIEGLK